MCRFLGNPFLRNGGERPCTAGRRKSNSVKYIGMSMPSKNHLDVFVFSDFVRYNVRDLARIQLFPGASVRRRSLCQWSNLVTRAGQLTKHPSLIHSGLLILNAICLRRHFIELDSRIFEIISSFLWSHEHFKYNKWSNPVWVVGVKFGSTYRRTAVNRGKNEVAGWKSTSCTCQSVINRSYIGLYSDPGHENMGFVEILVLTSIHSWTTNLTLKPCL